MKKTILLTMLLMAIVSFASCDNGVKVQDTFLGAKLGTTFGEAKKTIKDNSGYKYRTVDGICTFYDVEFGEIKWDETYVNQSHGNFVSIVFTSFGYVDSEDFKKLKKELEKKYPLKKISENDYKYTDSNGLAVELAFSKDITGFYLKYSKPDEKSDYSEL